MAGKFIKTRAKLDCIWDKIWDQTISLIRARAILHLGDRDPIPFLKEMEISIITVVS